VAVRVTKAQKDAVASILDKASSYSSRAEFIEDLAIAVETANDKTRWCVVTLNGENNITVWGPYASPDTARKAMATGLLAYDSKTRGDVFALGPAPKGFRQTKEEGART
jgi:hypothetical protein